MHINTELPFVTNIGIVRAPRLGGIQTQDESFFHDSRADISFHHLIGLSVREAYYMLEFCLPGDVGELPGLQEIDALRSKERAVRKVEQIGEGDLLHNNVRGRTYDLPNCVALTSPARYLVLPRITS